MTNPKKSGLKFAILIFAWNEAQVIGQTVENVRQGLRAFDRLYVIADNCSDDTADIARQAGSNTVIRRTGARTGKGAALAWFLTLYRKQMLGFDYILILDADNKIPKNFFDELSFLLNSQIKVGQCFLSPLDYDKSPLSTIISLSEIIEQTVFDRLRSRFGLSVRLRGTGMLFEPQLLIDLSARINTEVEDIALSLLLAERKILIRQFKSVTVYDPKPAESGPASRQRARWFRGQWKAFLDYKGIIAKLMLRGPSGWSVMNSLFLKPRWLKLLVLLIIGFVFWGNPVIEVIFFLIVFIEVLMILTGIMFLPNRLVFLRSLIYLPVFISMWVRGVFLSLKRRPWLRAREMIKEENYSPVIQRHP